MSKVIKLAELSSAPSLWQPTEFEGQCYLEPELEPTRADEPQSWEELQIPPLSPFSSWLPILFPQAKADVLPQKQLEKPEATQALAGILSWLPGEIEPLPSDIQANSKQGYHKETLNNSQVIIREAEERAAQIVQLAELQASQVLSGAETRAAELIQQAEMQVAEVTRKAFDDGRAAARADTMDLMQTATSIVEEFKIWREEQFAQAEMMMLRLVIEIAQSIFGEGLPLDPEVLGQAFSRALAQAKPLGNLRVYVHPEDVDSLSPYWTQRQATMSGQQIELIPSDIIKRGGCFVEGQYGSVDARVDSQFQLVKDSLLAAATTSQTSAIPAQGPEAGTA